ncbi:DMT family transporter [Micromonospora marina]|uniref:DMT family transporter n=1 Tax=Micromonospora marina TaxID=307120 RepID=UPI0034533B84
MRPLPLPAALAVVVAGGVASAAQGAVNAEMGERTGDPVIGAVVNSLGGLAVDRAGLAATGRMPLTVPRVGGAVLGVGIVLALLVGVRAAGVLRTGLALVAGQLGGALLLDLVLPGGPGVRLPVLAGALLTLLAVVVTGLRRRGPARVAAEGVREPDGRLVG